MAGNVSSDFCLVGAPVALAQFAQHLRYRSKANWDGIEPMRSQVLRVFCGQKAGNCEMILDLGLEILLDMFWNERM